jgi:hypothetical protein
VRAGRLVITTQPQHRHYPRPTCSIRQQQQQQQGKEGYTLKVAFLGAFEGGLLFLTIIIVCASFASRSQKLLGKVVGA